MGRRGQELGRQGGLNQASQQIRNEVDVNDMLREWKIRKIDWIVSETLSDSGQALQPPLRKVAAVVVLPNPALNAASDAQGLQRLSEAASAIGETLMPQLNALLQGQAVSYGKGAIVGIAGQLEHGAALLHPTLGKPMRAAIGGGAALIPSNSKLAAPGATLDVPLGHRNDPWSFDEIDTLTVSCADAPGPSEIMLVMALANGGRPNARVRKA